MNQISEYSFQYNIPISNDAMGRPDLFIEVKAELLAMCSGIAPLVSITFMETHSSHLLRIKDLNEAVRGCENIACEYFRTENQREINVVRLPTAVEIAEEYYNAAGADTSTSPVPVNKTVFY